MLNCNSSQLMPSGGVGLGRTRFSLEGWQLGVDRAPVSLGNTSWIWWGVFWGVCGEVRVEGWT